MLFCVEFGGYFICVGVHGYWLFTYEVESKFSWKHILDNCFSSFSSMKVINDWCSSSFPRALIHTHSALFQEVVWRWIAAIIVLEQCCLRFELLASITLWFMNVFYNCFTKACFYTVYVVYCTYEKSVLTWIKIYIYIKIYILYLLMP